MSQKCDICLHHVAGGSIKYLKVKYCTGVNVLGYMLLLGMSVWFSGKH